MLKTILVSLLTFLAFFSVAQERGVYNINTGEKIEGDHKKFYPQDKNLFMDDEPLMLDIISNFKALRKNKTEAPFQPAVYKIKINDTIEAVNDMRIKARGNFRRSRCYQPPIKLNFKKTEFFAPAIKNLKSLKLVGTCDRTGTSQELIFKEYLTYRMLNILTDNSLKVRLMKINFVDNGGKKVKNTSAYGFIIENIKDLAKRKNAVEIDRKLTNQDLTNIEHLNLITTFQFMIGNTDWSIPGMHNFKMIKSKEIANHRPYAIAYDFDFSGFVNAPYAHPNENLPISDVRTRLFRGLCRTPQDMESTFELFQSKKSEILELLKTFPYYSSTSKREAINYINEFYAIIDSSKKTESYFTVNCK